MKIKRYIIRAVTKDEKQYYLGKDLLTNLRCWMADINSHDISLCTNDEKIKFMRDIVDGKPMSNYPSSRKNLIIDEDDIDYIDFIELNADLQAIPASRYYINER